MGKAEKGKIFPVVHSAQKLEALLAGKKKIRIYANGLEGQAGRFAEIIMDLGEKQGKSFDAKILEGQFTGKICQGRKSVLLR